MRVSINMRWIAFLAFITVYLFLCGSMAFAEPIPVAPQEALATSAPPPVNDHEILPAAIRAQIPSPAPMQNANGTWDVTPVVANLQTFITSIVELIGTALVAWVCSLGNRFLGLKLSTQDVVRDTHMTEYAESAIAKAVAYGKQRLGASDADLKTEQIRNPVLALAAGFLYKQYPEVWKWVAQGEQGVLEYIEAHLSPDAALPYDAQGKMAVMGKAAVEHQEQAA